MDNITQEVQIKIEEEAGIPAENYVKLDGEFLTIEEIRHQIGPKNDGERSNVFAGMNVFGREEIETDTFAGFVSAKFKFLFRYLLKYFTFYFF